MLIFQGVIYIYITIASYFHNETIVNAPRVQDPQNPWEDMDLQGHSCAAVKYCGLPQKRCHCIFTPWPHEKCLYGSQPWSFLVDGQGLHSLDKYVDFDALRALVEEAEGEEGGI